VIYSHVPIDNASIRLTIEDPTAIGMSAKPYFPTGVGIDYAAYWFVGERICGELGGFGKVGGKMRHLEMIGSPLRHWHGVDSSL
jgi:hypothetical protein